MSTGQCLICLEELAYKKWQTEIVNEWKGEVVLRVQRRPYQNRGIHEKASITTSTVYGPRWGPSGNVGGGAWECVLQGRRGKEKGSENHTSEEKFVLDARLPFRIQ
jgi:hypothetical protein